MAEDEMVIEAVQEDVRGRLAALVFRLKQQLARDMHWSQELWNLMPTGWGCMEFEDLSSDTQEYFGKRADEILAFFERSLTLSDGATKACKCSQQTCKVCGRPDKFNFHVSDEVWASIIPPKFQAKVVCLSCFDEFAQKCGADYSQDIETLYFAGEQAVFEFRVVSGKCRLS